MDFYKVVRSRRSIRDYDPERDIPDEVLQRILEAGRLAPTASNRQPFRFKVIRSKKRREEICACYKGQWLKDAPVILVAVGYRDQAWIRQQDGQSSVEVDLTIALDHMILAAAAEGVGSCWILAYDYQRLKNVLHLKENEVVSCITPLGYPCQGESAGGPVLRKEISEIVEFI
jgi:nitroreductase